MGLTYLPLPDKNDSISIYTFETSVSTNSYELVVINTALKRLSAFRLGHWCKDPLGADTPPCIVKHFSGSLLVHLKDMLKGAREEAIAFARWYKFLLKLEMSQKSVDSSKSKRSSCFPELH